ncbi:hypothetical protein LTR53_009146 [Teratosphaeriaceae sp. CCFEE 6253]|nr:hypothetical protein LTR53_009146 [Teratosphaeriaceae sp. CCFEE 6253]
MDEPPIEVGGDAGPEEGAAVDVPVNIVLDDMVVLEPKSSVTVVEPVASGEPDGEDPGLIDVPGMLLDVVPGMLLDVVIALVNVSLSGMVDEEVSESEGSVLPADPSSVEATLCCDGSDVVLDSVLDVSYDHVDGVLYTGSRDLEAEYGGTSESTRVDTLLEVCSDLVANIVAHLVDVTLYLGEETLELRLKLVEAVLAAVMDAGVCDVHDPVLPVLDCDVTVRCDVDVVATEADEEEEDDVVVDGTPEEASDEEADESGTPGTEEVRDSVELAGVVAGVELPEELVADEILDDGEGVTLCEALRMVPELPEILLGDGEAIGVLDDTDDAVMLVDCVVGTGLVLDELVYVPV